MPVRLRITLLFTTMVLTILLLVGATVYYISYNSRLNSVKTRLITRAVNFSNMMHQSEVFNNQLIQKIDTSTSAAIRDKEIQVFNKRDEKIYSYSDRARDTLIIDKQVLLDARYKGNIYFTQGKKDAIALYNEDNELVIISATNDEPGKRNLFQLKIILWISLLAGLLISFAGGYFFSGRLLEPIKKIADEVNEISAKDLAKRIKTGGSKDEWHYLVETLNELLNRLEKSFEMQARFISDASHELSTPLTSISNQLDVSLQRKRDADYYFSVMQSVQQDVQHMNKLTQILLEFAKASGNPAGLEIAPVRIDEIILRMPAVLSKLDPSYIVKIEFDDLPEDQTRLVVWGNEELLFTAVKNILVNACKYSATQTAVLRLKVKAEDLIIEIADDGRGIHPRDYEKIFQPFYRSEATSASPGFGLGLSIASRIVKLHKGTIDIHSELNRGSVFTITLPSHSQL